MGSSGADSWLARTGVRRAWTSSYRPDRSLGGVRGIHRREAKKRKPREGHRDSRRRRRRRAAKIRLVVRFFIGAGFLAMPHTLLSRRRSPCPGKSDELEVLAERLSGPALDFRLVKADVYLYDLGLPVVPVDLRSDDMMEIFRQALAEISAVVKQGDYHQFELMMAELLAMPPLGGEPTWLWAAMRYRQGKKTEEDYDQDRVSHLAIRTDAGLTNKVRYTYPATLAPALAYAGFLLFLFEWKHSIYRVIAGGGIESTRSIMKGSVSPMWPTTICKPGCASNAPPRIIRSTCSAVSMCQPQPKPAIISLTIGGRPPYHAYRRR